MEHKTKITIIRHCPFCDKTHQIEVNKKEYLEAKNKLFIKCLPFEKAFAFFTKEQQEFISRGLCGLCYGKVYPKY
jgi:hypothetical protein